MGKKSKLIEKSFISCHAILIVIVDMYAMVGTEMKDSYVIRANIERKKERMKMQNTFCAYIGRII